MLAGLNRNQGIMKTPLRQRSQLEKQCKHENSQQWGETLEWEWSSSVNLI